MLRPLADRQGAPLRGHRGRAELAAPTMPQQEAPARGAANGSRKRHGAPIPCVAPSSAGSRRGKAWMFERMDARVHAGRRIPSNAGHRHREARTARQSGRLSLGYFSLAKQREVTRAGRRPDRKLLLCPFKSNDNNNPSKTTHAGRGHGPLLHQQHPHQTHDQPQRTNYENECSAARFTRVDNAQSSPPWRQRAIAPTPPRHGPPTPHPAYARLMHAR
jgi:hypothetical protein